MPWGEGPSLGTDVLSLLGSWHIHVPLGPAPQDTASSGIFGVVASIHGVTLVSDSALPFASFFAKSLIARALQ